MLKGVPAAGLATILLLSGEAFGLETFKGPSGETLNVSKCSVSPWKCLSEAAKIVRVTQGNFWPILCSAGVGFG